jgi:signal transduction histidine kinase
VEPKQEQEPATTILIVDDEIGIREGCRRVLKPMSHAIETADSLSAAMEMIQRKHYDLVLLDVMMPDGSGLDLCPVILERDPDTICIVITGYATIELAVNAVKRGAYDFLPKPFTSDQLMVAVRQGLERRKLRLESAKLEAAVRRAEQLARDKTDLEKLERIKSQFMLTVAHELRAPAAAMQSYVNLILAGYVEPDQLSPMLKRVQLRLQQLLDMIADVLALAHLKQLTDLSTAAVSPQPVADVLEDVLELLREQSQQKEQQLEVHILARPTIAVSRNHLRQIWTNLLSNAIKYTPQKGCVTVILQADQDGITGSVSDTGIGIAEQDRSNLFREFYRTDAAKATGEIGTGLGLAILKQIMDSYGGVINVQSQLGKGSCFTFRLPFDRAQPASQAECPGAVPAAADKGPAPPEPAPVRPAGTHTRVLALGDDSK